MSMWLMNGATVSSNLGVGGLDTSWTVVSTGDYNSDGKSDILLRHSSGYMSMWLMNGATVSSNLDVGGARYVLDDRRVSVSAVSWGRVTRFLRVCRSHTITYNQL